jgi:hypothetical protein
MKGKNMSKVILKPGILVALSTRVEGGVRYSRRDIDSGVEDDGAERVRWETERTIEDPAEHDRAVKARSAARSSITKVCSSTSFGLLCAAARESELDNALREARAITDAHNAGAEHTRVSVYVLKGRIAETDEEATRAIASEIRGLLDEMEAGIRDVNAEKIRDAAKRAKELGAVLGEAQSAAVERAVETARKAAKEIVRRVTKGGEDAKLVLEEIATKPIESARFAFLDLDERAAPEGEALPAVNVQRFADLEAS